MTLRCCSLGPRPKKCRCFEQGAAVAFGLMGMAYMIRWFVMHHKLEIFVDEFLDQNEELMVALGDD